MILSDRVNDKPNKKMRSLDIRLCNGYRRKVTFVVCHTTSFTFVLLKMVKVLVDSVDVNLLKKGVKHFMST